MQSRISKVWPYRHTSYIDGSASFYQDPISANLSNKWNQQIANGSPRSINGLQMVEGHVKQLEVVVVHQNSLVLHFVKILWSCISCGWEIDMGMDCRHNSFSRKNGDLYPLLYLNLFWHFYTRFCTNTLVQDFSFNFFWVWCLMFCPDFYERTDTFLYKIQMKLLRWRVQKITLFCQLPTVVTWSEIETKIGGLMCLLSAFYTNSIDLTDGKIKSG